MTNHTIHTAKAVRRFLHFLAMASLELKGLEEDDLLKEDARKKYKRYREKYLDWVSRDLRTDIKDWKGALEVHEEITSEKAMDLQMLTDFVLQFNNIGDITELLKEGFKTQQAA